ncbi:MAG: valine--tRNA ligase, partial [Anaerolineaceae bacterium]|nr:valine--tRNA ligase [Anaerolineaceae bacterium]
MAKTTLPKTYDFTATEQRLYDWWEKMGFFEPGNDPNKPKHDPSKKPFVISIPPANVTGKLHLGHAMYVSMEDLMVRYHRMKGEPTLWVPGLDHAGIATQLRVEGLLREQGTTREEVGREKFEEITWAWKHEYGGHITNQIRRLGASCDWSRERFTLDNGLSKAVREAFVTLFEQGLIYRGPRLINWSPGLQTAVSDLEVEYSEESGFMYHFRYMLADGSGDYLPVATTRPETILGDSGVAVHPEDPRYQKFIGKKVLVPMLNREIPVIADDYVDREFGTGALKVTPGHDPNDYEIGSRHNLEFINMMTKKATINENGGIYEGMDRFECRKKIWADMKEAGLVIKEEPHTHQVPRSQRGGEIIEPLISTQWFVNIKPLAEKAIAAVRDGRTKIVPERFEKVYFNWMENIRDWCISRQLWWGHRIPVWYCDDCGKQTITREYPTECVHCGSKNLQQDPDVLDTWFSSGLWPFSSLGWPEETPDLKYFYPTSVLETGYDILFFWVARMMMDGLCFTDEVPFHTIYLHGLIRDEHGQKMSKSKDNVGDPLITMDEFGTDALRFTLLVGSTPGNDMNLSLKKVEGNRNFANKVWNMARFIIGSLEKAPAKAEVAPQYTLADSWIWAKMNEVISSVERLFGNYLFGEAGRQIYDFLWNDFADWYLEIAKLQLSEGGDRAFYTAYTLTRVLDNCLRLLHPYTPFVTEELWQHLKDAAQEHSPELNPKHGDWEEALIVAKWPKATTLEGWENDKIAQFEQVQEVVRAIRNVRAEKKIQPGKKLPAIIVAGDFFNTIQSQTTSIARLANLDVENVKIIETLLEPPQDAISTVTAGIAIYLPLTDMVDTAAEKKRLQKELKGATSHIERLEKLLNSPFAQKAPAQ